MFAALEQKLAHYRELEQQLYDPAVATNPARSNAIGKERGALAKLIEPYLDLLKLDEAIKEAEAIAASADAEMRAMGEEELATLRPKRAALYTKIEDQLLLDPSEDFSKLIVEIRAGTGGDEAALFAGNLYEMYSRYARVKGWSIEEITQSPGEAGGFKEITFGITGDDVYQYLRYESGGHRVQRVPATETQGRIHTSLATVAVLPEPDEVQVSINMNDIEWETMRAGGAGGQHVNKTESAVRIWYKKNTPDQIEVKCQDGRSQHKNREQAMRVLRTRVFERQVAKQHQERAALRKNQIGGGDRNDRIRTYNFPQNRCTDHRIELSVYHLDAIMNGNLDEMITPMREADKQQRMAVAFATG